MNPADERGALEEMLPWHATANLARGDAERMEAALARDPALVRCYEMVREELDETVRLNEALGAPSAQAARTLFAKIDAEPTRRPPLTMNLGARIVEVLTRLSPRTLAWSALGVGFAVVLQTGLIADMALKEGPPGFQTASVASAFGGGGAYALIRFRPQSSAAAIESFLEAHNLSIVSGPSAGGLYRVQVAPGKLPKTDLARIVKTLQDDTVVSFVAAAQ